MHKESLFCNLNCRLQIFLRNQFILNRNKYIFCTWIVSFILFVFKLKVSDLQSWKKKNCRSSTTIQTCRHWPFLDGVHLVLDFHSVQVVTVHQSVSRLQSSIDLVLVGLHGVHKVLVLLQGLLRPGQGVGPVGVSQCVLLQQSRPKHVGESGEKRTETKQTKKRTLNDKHAAEKWLCCILLCHILLNTCNTVTAIII